VLAQAQVDGLAISTIDVLSVDTEGTEEDALSGLDFERYRPRLICVELNDERALNGMLRERGYYLAYKVHVGTTREGAVFNGLYVRTPEDAQRILACVQG